MEDNNSKYSPFPNKKLSNMELDLHTLYSNKSIEDREKQSYFDVDSGDESNFIQEEEISKPNQV